MSRVHQAMCWAALFWLCFGTLCLSLLGCSATDTRPRIRQFHPSRAFSNSPLSNPPTSNPQLSNPPSSDLLSSPPSLKEIAARAERDAEAGDPNAALREFGHRWFYGHGLGRTIANVGTTVAFPPYAIYILGNAGLSLAGYEQLWVTSALPEPVKRYTLLVYDGITSVPGRIAAAVSGEEFAGSQTENFQADPALSSPPSTPVVVAGAARTSAPQ